MRDRLLKVLANGPVGTGVGGSMESSSTVPYHRGRNSHPNPATGTISGVQRPIQSVSLWDYNSIAFGAPLVSEDHFFVRIERDL